MVSSADKLTLLNEHIRKEEAKRKRKQKLKMGSITATKNQVRLGFSGYKGG